LRNVVDNLYCTSQTKVSETEGKSLFVSADYLLLGRKFKTFCQFYSSPLQAVLKKRTLHNSGCLCHFQQNKDNLLIIQTNLMTVMVIQTNDQKEQDQKVIQQKHLRQGYHAN
jgi:hypothetical protein